MGFKLQPARSRPASDTACTSVCSAGHCPHTPVAARLTRSKLPAQQQRRRWFRVTDRLCTFLQRASAGDNLSSSPAQSVATPATATAGVAVTKPAVALDVEYAHYLTAEGKHVSVPAWVAVVDQHCALLLKTFIQHQVRQASAVQAALTHTAAGSNPALVTECCCILSR